MLPIPVPLPGLLPFLTLLAPPLRRTRMFENLTGAAEDDPKHSMPTMGFLDHLEELRSRLVYSIAAVAVGFFACWWKVESIYEIMQRPIMKALKDNGMSERLGYLNP